MPRPLTVAHLVEERLHVAEGEQRGRAADGRRSVAGEVCDWRAAEHLRAARADVHPRAAALVGGAAVRVEKEGRALLARLAIEQLVEGDVRMPDLRLAGRGHDRNAKEPLDQSKEAGEHRAQREVGAQLLLREGEDALAPALRPEGHVPQCERLGLPVLGRERAQRRELRLRGREGRFAHGLEQIGDGLRLRGHLARERDVRVRRAAEQRSHACAQLQDAPHARRVVKAAAGARARDECAVDPLAQAAVRGVLHERGVAGPVQRDEPAAAREEEFGVG